MNGSELVNRIHFKQIFFKGKSFDRNTVIDGINHLAAYLSKNNFSSSPFILITMYNHIKSVIAYYAVLKAGKIAVILDPGCKSIELSEMIEDTDPGAMIFLNTESLAFNYEEEIVFRKTTPGYIIKSDLKDVCTIAYTNAEDGYSKGAMLTEKNLLTEINAVVVSNKLNSNSVTYSLLPFYHLFGFVQGVLVSTQIGATGVITDFNLLRINDNVKDIVCYKVTHVYSVPSVYYILSKYSGIKSFVDTVKMFVSGGTKLNPFVYESFLKNTGKHIREGYGLTETSPACTLNYQEEDPILESVGKPIGGSIIKIVDENNHECNFGDIGEIIIKGDLVFKGYLNHELTTSSIVKDEWLHTGDLGRIDNQGFLYFCGLRKDMINVAGNNVYPKKLERIMKIHKNVEAINIYSEESILQGYIVVAKIKLRDSSKKSQDLYKSWCIKNVNYLILPKIWLFE